MTIQEAFSEVFQSNNPFWYQHLVAAIWRVIASWGDKGKEQLAGFLQSSQRSGENTTALQSIKNLRPLIIFLQSKKPNSWIKGTFSANPAVTEPDQWASKYNTVGPETFGSRFFNTFVECPKWKWIGLTAFHAKSLAASKHWTLSSMVCSSEKCSDSAMTLWPKKVPVSMKMPCRKPSQQNPFCLRMQGIPEMFRKWPQKGEALQINIFSQLLRLRKCFYETPLTSTKPHLM